MKMIKLPKNLYFCVQGSIEGDYLFYVIKIGSYSFTKGYPIDFSYENVLSRLKRGDQGWVKYHLIVQKKYQEAFCTIYPNLVPFIKELKPKIKDKFSHAIFGDKFKLFSE